VPVFLLATLGCGGGFGPSDQVDLRTDKTVYSLPAPVPSLTITLVNHTSIRLHWLACQQAFWLERREGGEWISERLIAVMCVNLPTEYDLGPGQTFEGTIGIPARVGLYRVAFAASGVLASSAPFAVAAGR
jgi:hypothetical protein